MTPEIEQAFEHLSLWVEGDGYKSLKTIRRELMVQEKIIEMMANRGGFRYSNYRTLAEKEAEE